MVSLLFYNLFDIYKFFLYHSKYEKSIDFDLASICSSKNFAFFISKNSIYALVTYFKLFFTIANNITISSKYVKDNLNISY